MGKYDDFTRGEEEALLNRLGGTEMGRAIGSGKYTVKIMGNEVLLAEAMEKLFDRHGRRIPSGLKSEVRDANRDFYLKQPNLKAMETYGYALARLQTHLKCGPFISEADFAARSLKLVEAVKANSQLANLGSGVCLPFCLPPTVVNDYGEKLEEMLTAFGQAYTKEYPRRSFTNYRRGELKGKVKVVKGSRHEEFLAKLARGTVVGLYCPTALQGYSIPAAREQMATLPDNLILAGGLDIAASLIMYPDVLARDWQTPGLDMAALSWSSVDCSLYFKADVDDARFNGGYLDADDYYSSGVVLLG